MSVAFTVLALRGTGPIYAVGEPVEQIRVTTTLGGGTQLAYVTRPVVSS